MPIGVLNKSILHISGDSAETLLNGLITQDISLLEKQNSIYSLFLNNKGRVLFACIIYKLEQNSYAIEIEQEVLMDLAKHIHKYDLSKKAELSILEDKVIAISFDQTDGLYIDPRNEKLGYRGLVAKNTISDNSVIEQYEDLRLQLAIPNNNDFIKEKSLANDLNTEELNGVCFNKGCYLGQELTSKTKHIKQTKNHLVSLDNTKYNIKQNNLTIYLEDSKVGYTFSYNCKFVLAIIKRSVESYDNLTFKSE